MSTSQPPPDRLIVSVDHRRDAVLDVIRRAQRRITLSLFRCNDDGVFAELAAASRRGVVVEALVTSRAKGGKRKLAKLWSTLEQTGALVKPYTDPVVKYHAKYLVADDGPALVTSLNFTKKCFESTRDFLVFSEDPEVVTGLKMLLEHDCHTPTAPLCGITDRLIVAPDHARRRVTERFRYAQTSIGILDHRVTDPEILALLREKQSNGVSVKVIGDVCIDGLVAHGRMILIDGVTAI